MPGIPKSKFLKENFNSMNMTEEEKLKAFNEYRKSITGVAAGEKEMEFLKNSIPKGLSDIAAFKKLLEEEKDK